MQVPEEISFTNGCLIIDDNSISFKPNDGSILEINTIARNNIGHVEQTLMKILPLREIQLIYRFFFGSALVAITGLVIDIATKWSTMFYLGVMGIAFSAFLLFSYFWLDNLLRIQIAKPILLWLFGVEAVRIVVQNTFGGNNMLFFIRKDEANRLPSLKDYKTDKVFKVEPIQQQANTNESIKPQSQTNNIDSLVKIAELYEKGLLTKEEFERKKAELFVN